MNPRFVNMLESASEGLLRFSQSDQFMNWVVYSIFTQIRPTHVSIALYNEKSNGFTVRFSTGKFRFPPELVQFDPKSPLVKCFYKPGTANEQRAVNAPVAYQYVATANDKEAHCLLEEMERYHVEVCAQIETDERLGGYLLIGPQENGMLYTKEELTYFQTLANDIAVELQKERYYQSSQFDLLTGLFSRNCLESKFGAFMKASQNLGKGFAVAMLDLDHFKDVNDRYGHTAGDQLLRIVSKIVRENIRQSDLAFRFGGEELLLIIGMNKRRHHHALIPADEFKAYVIKILDRLRNNIATRTFECMNQKIAATISGGVTFYDAKESKSPQQLISEADQALYDSKHSGRNKITAFLS